MVPVKIECDCGQHYAFEVEPVNGCMSSAIACPGCGADGTATANAIISRHLSSTATADAPVVIPPAKPALHIATSSYVSATALAEPEASPATVSKSLAYSGRQLGLVGREQAVVEARAKVSWGDSQETVTQYLMMQGYPYREAADLVEEMFKVRRAETRANGIRKLIIGGCLIGAALTMWAVFVGLDELTARVFARAVGVAVLVGCWGIWLFVNGAILLLVPGLDKRDVSDQGPDDLFQKNQ